MAAVIAVSIGPGQMQFTVMPCRPNSTAILRVRPVTPAFEAEYAAMPAVATIASVDAMFTTRPPWGARRRWSSVARTSRAYAVRLTDRVVAHASSKDSSSWNIDESIDTPALLTNMSMPPKASTAAAATEPAAERSARSATMRHRPPGSVGVGDLADHGGHAFGGSFDDGDVRAFVGEQVRGGSTHSGPGAGDDRRATGDRAGQLGQAHGHEFGTLATRRLGCRRRRPVAWSTFSDPSKEVRCLKSLLPSIAPAEGKLGVLIVGLGAVATTLIAGVELAKRGMAAPVGSLTQMGTIRLGKRTEGRSPLIKEFVPIAPLQDLVFGSWDPFPDDAYVAAQRAGVLDAPRHLEAISDTLREIRPMPAAFDQRYVKNIDSSNTKGKISKRAMLEAIREDIHRFKDEKQVDRLVMIWAASTEIFIEPNMAHMDLEHFEAAIDADDPAIAPSMLYAYAAILEDVPFCNGAPNLTVDIPVLRELAVERNVPISGKDFKTGQTLVKTVLAPDAQGPHARALGLVLDQHPRQPRR